MKDEQIVSLLFQREEAGLAECRDKYERYLSAVGRRILSVEEDVEECVSDTYLAAWNSIPPARPQNLGTWLGKVMRRKSIDRLRRESAEKRGDPQGPVAFEELAEILPDGRDLTEDLEAKELGERIASFLRTLPKRDRQLFVRRYYYYDSIAELSQLFGISESAAKMRLKRVRDRLGETLRREGYLVSGHGGEE